MEVIQFMNMKELLSDNVGQVNLRPLIGTIVVIIVLVAAAIPVVLDVISSANLTGTTALIVGLAPVFLGLAVLVIAANLLS